MNEFTKGNKSLTCKLWLHKAIMFPSGAPGTCDLSVGEKSKFFASWHLDKFAEYK